MKQLAVAILNWNGKKHLAKFLPSVVANSPEADIILIDNGSTDDSLQFIRDNYVQIQIIPLDKNYGFCGGYNRGVAQIEHELILLLNSDIEVTERWLPPLLKEFNENTKLVAAQPKVLSYNNKKEFEHAGASGGFIDKWGYPFCRGRIFDTCEQDTGQYDSKKELMWATGAALMIRTNSYKEAGGLDETFFAHMEEIDLCWRLKNRGHSIQCIPESTVYHLGGGTLPYSNPKKTFLNFRNGLAIILKNNFEGTLLIKMLIRLILDGVAGVKFLLDGNPDHTIAIVRAHFSFYSRVPSYYNVRKANKKSLTDQSNQLYPRSIVLEHYLRSKKKFSDLNY